ncbi:unnamed protein product [Ostreobium quekettii]|uniref:Uncharacterized protein n=1 Tax=Ostreobium quekettii TaxID=121088 RepID=A0A8S1IN94_9CHLO|nr:unnamed protein product [Ostreobium quekettii]
MDMEAAQKLISQLEETVGRLQSELAEERQDHAQLEARANDMISRSTIRTWLDREAGRLATVLAGVDGAVQQLAEYRGNAAQCAGSVAHQMCDR